MEGRMEQVLYNLYQEHIINKKFCKLYLPNQMFVNTYHLINPTNTIELLMKTGESLSLKTASLFGQQMPYNDSHTTFKRIVDVLARSSVLP